MTTISSREMRERVLSRFERASADSVDWQNVIGVEGNRRLLGLIIDRAPASVADLAALAGRAQSNVSRSLVALVRSGLVELRQNGRVSTPVVTPLGSEKAAALDLPKAADENAEQDPQAEEAAATMMSVAFDPAAADVHRVRGSLDVALRPRGAAEPLMAKGHGDLTWLCERWLTDWWRILHRRDTSYRLCDLSALRGGSRSSLIILVRSHGNRMEISARLTEAGDIGLARDEAFLPLDAFQRTLRKGVLNPVAAELSCRGERDRPLHGLLGRLEEIEESSRDLAFHRTAGALNLSSDALDEDTSQAVTALIEQIPDEEARLELASSLVLDEMIAATDWIATGMADNGERNRLVELDAIAAACRSGGDLAGLKPYARGLELAKRVRAGLRLAPDRPVGGLTGLATAAGAPDFRCSGPAPGDLLGFQNRLRDAPTAVVNGDGGDASSFLLARAIGDYLAFGSSEACIAEIYTDRQAVNRAFAAEMVAPSKAVVDMIDEGSSWKQVARHFGTSTAVVRHQFDNNADRRGHRQWRV